MFGQKKHFIRIQITRAATVSSEHFTGFFFDRFFLRKVFCNDFHDSALQRAVFGFGNDQIFPPVAGEQQGSDAFELIRFELHRLLIILWTTFQQPVRRPVIIVDAVCFLSAPGSEVNLARARPTSLTRTLGGLKNVVHVELFCQNDDFERTRIDIAWESYPQDIRRLPV